ncbi:MAG: hypothetical protein IT437_06575 [Phycisphaerales bacterium]|nr:hypothetical protein [Phycisphaerales bacterium]
MRVPAYIVAAVVCGAMLPSCNIVGPAVAIVHGPEKVPAAYGLDPALPTVVFVDDLNSRVPRRSLRLVLAQAVEQTLLDRGGVKDVISAQSALSASKAEKDGRPLSIAEIGKAVGASVVVYMTVDSFSLFPDGQAFAPMCQVRVKVIDASSDKRVWPEDRAGHTVVTRAVIRGEISPNVNDRARAEDELARQAGVDVAQLFFKHERPRGATGNEP